MNNILYVDTSKFFGKILNEIGKLQGFKCKTICCPTKAYDILKSSKTNFDLIITALEFPHETGLNFLQNLKNSEYKEIPVVVVSSHTDEDMKKEVLFYGAHDYITKNISITRLIQLIVRIEKETFVKKYLFNKKVAFYSEDKNYILKWQKTLLQHRFDVLNVEFFDNPEDVLNTKSKYSLYIIDSKYKNTSIENVSLKIRQTNKNSIIFVLFDNNAAESIADFLLCGADDFIVKKSNGTYLSETNIALFIGKLYSSIRTYNLMKEIEEKNKKLEELVNKDSLTNLYNHNYMYNILNKKINYANNNNQALSIFMIDIDDFKAVNDAYGHQVGDLVLKSISNLLTNRMRKTDIVGRYGGEEFLIILPNTNLHESIEIAEEIRYSVSNIKYKEANNLKLTLSIGVVELKNENALDLVKKADDLLYVAKKEGKNRVVS